MSLKHAFAFKMIKNLNDKDIEQQKKKIQGIDTGGFRRGFLSKKKIRKREKRKGKNCD